METKKNKLIVLSLTVLALAGCKAPSINLATSEPIKVDINMRLDVYEYSSGTKKSPTTITPSQPDVESRRRNRMADIQQFKNSRLVGEGREGLLSIRQEVQGDFGDYIRKTVDAENADRMDLMKQASEKQKTSLLEIQKQQAENWRNRSFKEEWIETPQADGSWKWIQKEG